MRRLALVVPLAVLLAACSEPLLTGFVRQPTPSVAGATLPDVGASGAPFEFRADQGQLLLVYFGYTACPDVCPTTLADTKTAMSRIGDEVQRIDFAMATVDPMRDTEDVITAYVHGFIPDGHALRTEDNAQLLAAAEAFGASYSVDPDVDGEYVVTHTGSLYAVDDEGNLLITWPFGISIDDLTNDLEILLDRA